MTIESNTTYFILFRGESRRIKGAGREGRQYEPVVREGRLIFESGSVTLPDGTVLFGEKDWPCVSPDDLLLKCWTGSRANAEAHAIAQAERRDSEPVRQLRRLAAQSGHGGNGLHKLLGVHHCDIASYRNGKSEIPTDVAAKIAALLG